MTLNQPYCFLASMQKNWHWGWKMVLAAPSTNQLNVKDCRPLLMPNAWSWIWLDRRYFLVIRVIHALKEDQYYVRTICTKLIPGLLDKIVMQMKLTMQQRHSLLVTEKAYWHKCEVITARLLIIISVICPLRKFIWLEKALLSIYNIKYKQ